MYVQCIYCVELCGAVQHCFWLAGCHQHAVISMAKCEIVVRQYHCAVMADWLLLGDHSLVVRGLVAQVRDPGFESHHFFHFLFITRACVYQYSSIHLPQKCHHLYIHTHIHISMCQNKLPYH